MPKLASTPFTLPAAVVFAMLASSGIAQTAPQNAPPTTQHETKAGEPGFALTVYSTADPATFDPKQFAQMQQQGARYGNGQNPLPGYGVVRETRVMELDAGRNTVRFEGVASGIDPTTVAVRSFGETPLQVIEQSYEYDLLDAQKLLEKFVGQTLQLAGDRKKVQLLSVRGGSLVYKEIDENGTPGPVRMQPGGNYASFVSNLEFPDTAGLILQPTLVWDLQADKAGTQPVQVSYQTDGITWRADYSLVANADDSAVDVSAWVTLLNESGMSYPNTTLKLVAGDVQRIQPPQQQYAGRQMAEQMSSFDRRDSGFAEKSFFEYHLYTLGRPTSLPDHSTKQIELFPPKPAVPVEKIFVYYGLPEQYRAYVSAQPMTDRNFGTESNKKVDIYLQLANTEANGMGVPLPAGRVRVYKRDDADGSLEFVGEDVIQHTPRQEKVMVKLGSAFDIVGERKQTDFTVNANGHVITESFEIKLRNRKTEPVTVIVKENLFRWANWEITKKSDDLEKQDYRTIHFPVTLQPDDEKTVTYTVKYTW